MKIKVNDYYATYRVLNAISKKDCEEHGNGNETNDGCKDCRWFSGTRCTINKIMYEMNDIGIKINPFEDEVEIEI